MLSAIHRFHGHNSLRYAYQNGKTVRGPLCAMRYVHNDRRQSYRLAIVVSKKISKSAVVRNRIRRRIYEIVRSLDIVQPYDLIITVFTDQLATMPFDEVERAIVAQCRQAGVLSKTE